jgi:hypothetical protein
LGVFIVLATIIHHGQPGNYRGDRVSALPRPAIEVSTTDNLNSAGVIGLSTALSIQEHLSSTQSVLLVARDFPSDTSINYASPWAGAHYRPVPGSSPQALREANQALRTFNYLKQIAAGEPAAGIKFVKGIEHLEAPPPEYLDNPSVQNVYHFEDFRSLTTDEIPAGVKWGVEYGTYVINSPVYCAHMLRKFIVKGGRTQQYTLVNIKEAFALADNVKTVVNCSGTGFADPKSFIIRGEFIFVPLSTRTIRPLLNSKPRPNLSGSQPCLRNNHPPERRRNMVLLHPAPARRWHRHRRNQATPRLGPEPVPRNQSPTPQQRLEMVPLHRRKQEPVRRRSRHRGAPTRP